MKAGLRENWKQFTMLVIVKSFAGGMIRVERSILPQLAELEFEMLEKSARLSFIVVFGFAKAITNYFAGTLAIRMGRKILLISGGFSPFLYLFC